MIARSGRPLGTLAVLLALAPPSPGVAETVSAEELRVLAADAMAAGRLPSLSFAVSIGGRIAYAGALGLADVENAVPATPETVYRIGSVAKTLTATAALHLAEEGRLDLDAPIERYCPAFPPKGDPITARQLLGHLGGIRDYDYSRFREEFLSARRYETLDAALTVFRDDPLVAPPGTRHRYSGFGYVLLGCAIEGASGMTYADQVREAVLEPAAMTRTLLDVPEAIVPHRSRGYGTAEDGSWRNSVFVDLSDRFPAGGWLSTPADLARFGDALLAGELLSEGSVGRMWQEGRTAEGKPTAYGLGWRLGPDGCEVFHGGSSVGGSAYLYLRPASRTVVAFATNLELWNDPRHALARRLADAASGPGSCP